MTLPRRQSHALLVLTLAVIWGSANPFSVVRAEVPSGPPTFSNSLNIDNAFFPFEPDGLKRFEGNDHGTKIAAVDYYLTTIRTFTWNSSAVGCHILVEEAYEDEVLVERSFNYFAQADDGTVYYFGEVVNNFDENGAILNHDGSWLVGGPQGSDPAETATASDPAVFMPANPEVGDTFKPEDLFPIVDETVEVVDVDVDVNVPAGKHDGAIKVEESTLLGPDTELKWYAPGVGVVKVQTRGETLRLTYSTLVQPVDD